MIKRLEVFAFDNEIKIFFFHIMEELINFLFSRKKNLPDLPVSRTRLLQLQMKGHMLLTSCTSVCCLYLGERHVSDKKCSPKFGLLMCRVGKESSDVLLRGVKVNINNGLALSV